MGAAAASSSSSSSSLPYTTLRTIFQIINHVTTNSTTNNTNNPNPNAHLTKKKRFSLCSIKKSCFLPKKPISPSTFFILSVLLFVFLHVYDFINVRLYQHEQQHEQQQQQQQHGNSNNNNNWSSTNRMNKFGDL